MRPLSAGGAGRGVQSSDRVLPGCDPVVAWRRFGFREGMKKCRFFSRQAGIGMTEEGRPMSESQFPKLVDLMARLRGPSGCPWDRQQTFDTIKPFLLEETYEVVDAIGRRDWDELANELGDLLLQIVFFAQMAAEEKHFAIEDVIERIHTKMVRRHPHVFGDAQAETAADVLRNWEILKAEEKRQRLAERGEAYQPPESVLAGVSSGIPSLMEAFQLSSRAAHVGFDWMRFEDVLAKLQEEVAELRAVMTQAQGEQKETGKALAPASRAR